ncbi:RNase adapter protein RapZ [invertebrate metagenome]|uniref:RNase adapter protein RapZ n=1 Tax=invertebrate metagenome TaxID=1711999 RepID=A0A2H9TC80_9ZZZZ
MKLIVISGRSGSGKSTALHALEDEGYYCVDNLPASMLDRLPEDISSSHQAPRQIAVSIDVRNLPGALAQFPRLLKKLRNKQIECQVLFLDADSNTLIKRYSSTRRKHPLTNNDRSLAEALELETRLLAPVLSTTDIKIDTSPLSVHDVRKRIKALFCHGSQNNLTLLFQSFGFKHGVPVDSDMVFDVRCLPNPYWIEALRKYTGKDKPIQEFLEKEPDVIRMYDDIAHFINKWLPHFETGQRSYMNIAIGCTGGQHRSVYLTERLGQSFEKKRPSVQVRHRELTQA